MTDATAADEQRRWALAARLLEEHAGDEQALILDVGSRLGDAIQRGDKAEAEDWRLMIGVIVDLGRKHQ